jgi:hypothetical protein
MKTQKKRAAKQARFRPGATGACESQLWIFSGPPAVPNARNVPDVHWVAAESLDAALQYVRHQGGDFIITEVRLVAMVALLSGSPLD